MSQPVDEVMVEGRMIIRVGGEEESHDQFFRCSTVCEAIWTGLSGRLSCISKVKLTSLYSHDMLCFLHNKQ